VYETPVVETGRAAHIAGLGSARLGDEVGLTVDTCQNGANGLRFFRSVSGLALAASRLGQFMRSNGAGRKPALQHAHTVSQFHSAAPLQ